MTELKWLCVEDRNKALEILMKARLLISNRDRWCQRAYVRNVILNKKECTQYCITGAVERTVPSRQKEVVTLTTIRAFLENQLRVLEYEPPNLEWFNDTHEHEEVLAFLDQVISKLERDKNEDRTIPVVTVSAS